MTYRSGSLSRAGQSSPRGGSKTDGESIDLITFISPASGYSESHRTIRSSVLLSFAAPGLKCIAVSSPLPQEGKSTTLSNFSVTLAQDGKRVLVVDSDLRKPRQHKIKTLGVILNNLIIRKHDYYYRHQHYQYYGDKGDRP